MSSFSMTREERETFLADVHVGILSLTEEGRGPLTVPIWYGYIPGGQIWFVTGRHSRKAPLMSEGVRMSFCVQTETPPYKYVSVEGPISSIEAADRERDLRPLAHRYLGPDGGDQYIESTTEVEGEDSGIRVSIQPERWLSVDYSKGL